MSDRASSPTQQNREIVKTEVQVKEEESSTSLSPITSAARTEADSEAPSSSPNRTRTTGEQRRLVLLEDTQAQQVEPRRVLCRVCRKWIKLSGGIYSLSNWRTHQQRCHDSASAPPPVRRAPSKPTFSPDSRVATAERKIVLLNDPQVKECTPAQVLCGTCKSAVVLEGQVEYDLTKWTEHKEKCIPMTPHAPITPQGSTSRRPRVFPPPSTSNTHSQVSARRPPRSPTPVGENGRTKTTDSSPVAVKVGVKRGREEEEGEVAADERPTNRARTETHKPLKEGAPSLLGWFMHPLKEFARGFREGLAST